MKKVLVSGCLVGDRVRYNGADKRVDSDVLERWQREGRLVRFCPEVAGGLGVPRPPAERQGARIVTAQGVDVTREFERGAQLAVDLVRAQGITVAVLKENSPSCGSSQVNDGTFTGTRIGGAGLTTEHLRAAGVTVFSEAQLDLADALLRK